MVFDRFTNGYVFTVGAELELRILDEKTLTYANEYEYFKENIPLEYKENITSEFLKSMIEINTPVFNSVLSLIEYLKNVVSILNEIASKKSLVLQSSGASALKQENIELSSSERYQELSHEHRILLDDFSICGLHVHIGFRTFDKALAAYNYSLEFLPLFLALSASSVYSNGIDTGIHSYRTKVFDRLPKASIPEYFDSYGDMKSVYNTLYETGVINSEKDVWWDVRIQASLKTVEFRVCDAINDFDRLEVIICMFRAMCKLSQDEESRRIPMQILKQNMWKASRYSMDADFIYKNKKISIREAFSILLERMHQKEYICDEFYEKAKNLILKNSISQDMIEIYEKTKDLKEVEKLGVIK
jgi:carboxylate-amine ligase